MKFDLVLYGKNEFYPKLNSKTYNVLKANNKENINYMIQFFIDYIEKVKLTNKSYYIGIDFEFRKISKKDRDVALMQINLEDDDTLVGFIFLLYPPDLNDKQLDILIQLLSEPNIIKILHGSESLDIPYLFNQILKTKDNITGFCSNFYDTKYLCDYYRIVNNNADIKCSIYNLLLDHKIISQAKLTDLNSIEEHTGPIYLVVIDLYNMTDDIFKYSLYDVIYLPELIKKFINNGIIYKKIIPQVSCVINKYRRNIEDEFSKIERIINYLNIAFIYDGDEKILLKDIWENYFYFITDQHKYLEYIMFMHYFKNFFEVITKMLIFNTISKIYPIYKMKENVEDKVYVKFNYYYKWLSNYSDLYNIFMDFQNIINKDLNNIKIK
jgi:hypothetical protein